MTNETMHTSSFGNEAKNAAKQANEPLSWIAALFSLGRFSKSKFGQGKVGIGGPMTVFTNEAKNGATSANETIHSSSFSNEIKH